MKLKKSYRVVCLCNNCNKIVGIKIPLGTLVNEYLIQIGCPKCECIGTLNQEE